MHHTLTYSSICIRTLWTVIKTHHILVIWGYCNDSKYPTQLLIAGEEQLTNMSRVQLKWNALVIHLTYCNLWNCVGESKSYYCFCLTGRRAPAAWCRPGLSWPPAPWGKPWACLLRNTPWSLYVLWRPDGHAPMGSSGTLLLSVSPWQITLEPLYHTVPGDRICMCS